MFNFNILLTKGKPRNIIKSKTHNRDTHNNKIGLDFIQPIYFWHRLEEFLYRKPALQ